MTDLTKITTPFGLLDAETQKALREYEGEIEFYGRSGWIETIHRDWELDWVYRAKPQPPKPREWWVVEPHLRSSATFDTLMEALQYGWSRADLIHVREVLE